MDRYQKGNYMYDRKLWSCRMRRFWGGEKDTILPLLNKFFLKKKFKVCFIRIFRAEVDKQNKIILFYGFYTFKENIGKTCFGEIFDIWWFFKNN